MKSPPLQTLPPQPFYQIQTKFRDEVRPRFGVISVHVSFIMKDAYSFHILKSLYKRLTTECIASIAISLLVLVFRTSVQYWLIQALLVVVLS